MAALPSAAPIVLFALAACTAPPPAESGSTSTGNLWSDCYATFAPSGNPKSDLERLTGECGRVGGMQPLTPVKTGTQGERDPADHYRFIVPDANTCYRIYATADRNVDDLDLLLRAPDGTDVAGDLTHDAWPIVPPRAPLCIEEPGTYLLEVSVFRGRGRYALQIWGIRPD
jgi:hypothetical protein